MKPNNNQSQTDTEAFPNQATASAITNQIIALLHCLLYKNLAPSYCLWNAFNDSWVACVSPLEVCSNKLLKILMCLNFPFYTGEHG